MIAKANTILRQLIESGRIFFGDEIRAHAIPNDENDVTRFRSGINARPAGQDRDGKEKEFSQEGFQQPDLRLRSASCHPERMRGTSHLLITHTGLKNFDQLRGPSPAKRLGMTKCGLHVSLRAEV